MDFHANTSSYWTGTSASTDTLASTKWFAGDGNSVTNEYEVQISSWWYAEIHIKTIESSTVGHENTDFGKLEKEA